jgi:RHS repeat-associated protein
VQDTVEWFGDYSTNVQVPVSGASGNGGNAAQCTWQNVPSTMVAGQSYTMTVKILNTGTSTWTTANNYNLGSSNDYGGWGLYRVPVPSSIAPNQEATFTFAVTAPLTPGTYTFQWRMVQDYVEWFGDTSTNVSVIVTTQSPPQVHWLVTDQLGTPRMVFDQTGALNNVKRHDYLPFGEELFAGIDGRSAVQGYSVGDGVRQQFTGKERDIETGLDYFLARYYSSSQGRFVSIDPLMASGRGTHPQTWNRYSYVLNNPLRLTDSTGMVVDTMGEDELEKKKAEEAQQQQQTKPPQQPAQTPKTLDLRQDPNIVSVVDEIKQNAAPLKPGERPVLTSVVVVEGQTSNVQDTKLIDAYGNVSPAPFTGVVKPVAYIPLDQGCNIIQPGNGVLLGERVESVRGPDPGGSAPIFSPDSGVFIDIQNLGKGLPTVEIKQNVKVQQGRFQIDTGPNKVIKDAGAGTISFTLGPQTKRVFQ